MSLSPKHERDGAPIPKHPYRDSALMYGALAVVILLVAMFTDGDVGKAVLVALGFFVAATAWAWFRFRSRIKARAEAAARETDA